ncbi:MAG: type II toxin-antitoxin system prevent-host-death family antitoxin [Polyangia bacterium]|mgnify:CR=1 FL=1|jgi:prevent-host-death family protein|nr:type II toxin-antitoxin system prevent-host-death family antitoxin [Polyangia bacterium]
MSQIGAYDAKTHLPKLLERVARGERITITKHGVPVAVLVPAGPVPAEDRSEVIAELKAFRAGRRLEGESLREMIEAGRP